MQAPLFRFNEHRADIEREVVTRVMAAVADFGGAEPPRSHQLVLNDAAWHEIRRLEAHPGSEARLEQWQALARHLGRMDADALASEVRRLAEYYVGDVVGHFDPRVYRFASRVLPVGLGMLFNAADVAVGLRGGFHALRDLAGRIRVEGELDTLRRVARGGTLVFIPTHSSNMDSIVLGWALMEADLPPVTYGAGKNLFTNPLIGYFMRNLGAYRVDRRLKHELYKLVLKTYSQVLLERGYHSLFFPGGTRSRSGGIENKLKLGLMGTALTATSERLRRGDDRPIYIVPVTINYPLVLEAETLVGEHLKEAGQARYIIEDDEFSRVSRVTHYAIKLMGLDTSMVIRFGAPLDVFGNPVGPDGESRRPDGSPLRRERYLFRDGELVDDPARDAEYTRHLGREVAHAFRRETVVLPTALLGWLLSDRERRRAPHLDLYALLSAPSPERHPLAEVHAEAERVRDRLVALERAGALHLPADLRAAPIAELVDRAVRTFGMYHAHPAVERDGDGLVARVPRLLYFYGNRLASWAPELREALR
jgi:glycerol-3-phosphate O-acyltransferase